MAVPCGNHICSCGGGGGDATNVVLVVMAALATTIALLLVSATAGCVTAAAAAMRQGDAKTEVQMPMEASVAGAFFVSLDVRCCGDGGRIS